ncbi:multidrug MFS transporter [Synechococcus sp. KORDI-100]|uniref:TIGR01777 family oxidoreductase n=1 Tax=Synechococcus sp. KORDI-100 TaxID=1280380 RepID=UPI0004E0A92A|nr:TIGR01777 family oxidoreductase [Synechococcus sp. KORDI-100]AII44581.1 multidrug MFS transporter [Synechococcus sp. KORDI-100]
MRLLLLGCTGFVGRELVPLLLEAGHQLSLVSRRLPRGFESERADGRLEWLQLDPSRSQSWQVSELKEALQQADGVVNLAGEPIAEKRWTPAHRQLLETSRLETTRLLVEAISASPAPPSVLVNASAVGFYGTSSSARFKESSAPGDDFLASLCARWEAAAMTVPSSTRQLTVRIGIVLAPDGGALGKMLPVFRAGFGGPIGDGRQWMSWIHRSDLCDLIIQALTDERWTGVVNGVAPEPVTMAAFSKQLGRSLGRPSLLPVPAAVLQVLLGDGAKVVLEGQQVDSERLQELGFSFRYPDLPSALSAATS